MGRITVNFAGMFSDILRVSLAVAATLAVLLGVNAVAANVDRSVYRERAGAALVSGELGQMAWFPLAAEADPRALPYRYNHNDCLILSMLILEPKGTALQKALSPLMPSTKAERNDPRLPDHDACWRFAAALEDPARPAEHYHRYLHGHWVLAGALLPLMSFGALTAALLLISIAIPLAAAAVGGVRLARGGGERGRNLAYLLMGLAGPMLISTNGYGRSLSFAPSDIVIFSFLLFTLVRPLSSLSDRSFVLALALFGALTASFEFLIGAVPAALAVFVGCLALDPSPDARLLLRRAAKGTFCFTLAVVLAFLLKWLPVALVWDWQALFGAAEKLAGWTRESRWTISLWAFPEIHQLWGWGFPPEELHDSRLLTIVFAFLRMANQSSMMGFGSPAVGFLIIVAGPVLLAASSVLGLIVGRGPANRARPLLMLLGPLIFIAWHSLFVHHSILHAYFMQRPFAWLTMLLLGWLGWIVENRTERLASRSAS